jgi:hypothetical protein
MPKSTPPNRKNQGEPPKVGHVTDEPPGQGAHGRYGIEEEPNEPAVVNSPRTAKDPDEIARDAARDAEVKNTGEDLG